MGRIPHQKMFFDPQLPGQLNDANEQSQSQSQSAFDLEGALAFCLALTASLQGVHERGERYGVMCLANIRLKADGSIELREDPSDSLAYIAPEQTGRMNRKVDQRSDYYSLGAVMYELLTGRPPFDAASLMELVHSHIARLPVAPAIVNHGVPEVLSDMVMKLLAKNAEDRYQGLAGLAADLRRCRAALADAGVVTPFTLGEHDLSDRLNIPEKLYGRENEVRQLLQAFGRIAQGGVELLLVSGYAGIGKSALVNQIHQPVVAWRGYFVAGKFDQFRRNIPYSAIHHALRELIRQILTEDEVRIAEWRTVLQAALGANGQMMIDALPELEFLIGPQTQSRAASSMSSYSYVMQKFVGVFARIQHPLVLFLDDLQWADAASLKLINILMKDLEDPCLLLIGAYRNVGERSEMQNAAPGTVEPATGHASHSDPGDHAMPDYHPLMQAVAAIRKDAIVHTIALTNLPQTSITELVSDTFRSRDSRVVPLARLIYRKTLGNPFFVGQFIKSLYNQQLLQFRDQGWRWDMAQIEALDITDNVVELLMAELARLPQPTQTLLALAACIGNRFDIATLSVVSHVDVDVVRERMRLPVAAGLIRALSHGMTRSDSQPGVYAFQHDRVQQAAYEGIPHAERAAVHLKVGQVLLQTIHTAQHEERIFDIVPHLNLGRSLLVDADARNELAQLNLLAARRARESAALDVHSDFVALADELGAVAVWGGKPAFMHALTMEKISAAFARGDYRSMADLCELVSANSATAEQAIAAKNMLLRCYGSSFKPAELMATGMELMALAGIRAPKRLCALHVWWARLRLAFALRGRDPLTLADFPEPQDPQYLRQLLATTALLGFGFGFYKDSAVIQWLSLELIRKGIRHGVSPSSAYAFVVWGSTLAGKYDKPQAGYKFAKVGALLGARGSMVTLSTVSLFEGTVRHRREAIRLSLAPLMESYHRATERGDRTGAVVALQFADALRFHGNVPLDQCLQQMRKNIAIARRMDYQAILNMMLPIAITTALLNGTAINDMTGGLELESFALQRTRAGDQWSVFYVRAVQCVGEYYFGDIAAALEHAVEAIGLPGFKYGTPHTASLMFFSSLARLDRARLQGGTPSFVLAEVKAMQRHLQGWASHAPMNYLHKWQLVQAELRLAQNRPQQALDYFDRAILGARNNGYIGDEALANELMGRYLRSAGKYIEARAHMEEAHAKYVEWGAHAKAAQLERIYPGLMKRVTDARHVETARVTSAGDQRLDIDTVIKVSQALSSEIQLDKLLQKLMHILIENAGAQSGILLLQKDGLLRTQATYRTEVRNGDSINLIEVLQDTKAEQQPDLCMAIVNYVKRMRETLVIGDAQKDLRFNSDPHIRESEVKSVLCIPLQKQGELAGIFYLENMLAIDAFTPAHTELLQILSTQIAISLENADLYNELEQKIAARTEVISQRNVALRDTLDSLRQTQRQLVESEKLASLGQLVAGVAHEINTPIGIAVTGASTLAEHTATLHALLENETLRKSDMKKYIESAGTISKLLLSNMERAAALIQSFKAVAVDQTSEERRTFPLRAYLENVLLNLSPLLRRTEHQVVLQCDPDITIDSYPGALSQVVTNLVTNALQHGFDRIDSGVISIDVVELDGQLIELRFADNGNGIAPDSLRKIFDPFFTTRRGQGGSGLGLNIIHNLVTGSLQGKIRVDSAVGRGTTFWLSFPRNPRATAVTGDQAEHKGAYVE